MSRDAGDKVRSRTGRLVVVGTPIGNLGDLSPRAAQALADADVIACEDTRQTGKLLALSGIEPKRLLSVHGHNESHRSVEVVALIAGGATVALVADAGMPAISDPGGRLVAAVADAGHDVVVVPGPSAATAAYALSGLASSRYVFEGFLPRRGAERRVRIAAIASADCPSIVFESPLRIAQTVEDLARICGSERRVAICRELTKLYEEVWRGTLGEAAARSAGARAIGEHVIVVAASDAPTPAAQGDVDEVLQRHLSAGRSRRDAVADTARELSMPKRHVYEAALRLPAPLRSELTWTDSHCHVHTSDAPMEELERASAAGVNRLICIGTGEADSLGAIEFARSVARTTANLPEVYATVGLHPHDAVDGVSGVMAVLSENLESIGNERSVIVAIGECGLDFHYDHSPRPLQRAAFGAQIELAHRHRLPLVVHTREAWDETFDLLESEGVPERLIFHCFTGGVDEASRCLEIGGYLSFSGIVTFKTAEPIRAAAEACPLDRLLVETDSPYLAPVPHRGKPNEPMWVTVVGAAIADLKQLDQSVVAKATHDNAALVLGLGGANPGTAAHP